MLKAFFCLFSLLMILACSASYENLKTVDTKMTDSLAGNLFNTYKEKAIYEAEEMHDWNSTKLYSEKALNALKGVEIKPQEMTYWKLPNNHIFELNQSYNNLIMIYEDGKILDPYNLAVAISSLDCWAEQQEENWQTWDINKCRDDFLNAMHTIYEKVTNHEKNQVKKTYKNKKENKTENLSLVTTNDKRGIIQIIYFDFDESTLSKVNMDKIKRFLVKHQNQISNFIIVGHTDTKGTNDYNLILSLNRAEAVKAILLKEGIKKENISVLGKGEGFLAVQTANEVANPANRRAEIITSN